MRLGREGRVCRRWWLHGHRPPGPVDQRYAFAYVFAAVEPATGRGFCLVLPEVSTGAMGRFPEGFAAALPGDVHAVLVLDGAGPHTSRDLAVPGNVTLVRLPPCAPQLNPVERVWLYPRERFLSHRLHADCAAVLDAAGDAWRRLTAERLRSLCDCPWIRKVTSWTRRYHTREPRY